MRDTKPIPFSAGGAPSIDELSGASLLPRNFMPDAAGALYVRPGIRAWDAFPSVIPNASPVVGVFPWRAYIVYVCADRTIWAWLAAGLVQALSDATAATQLDGALPPVFTYDSDRVVITGGGAPQKWEGVGMSSRLAPGEISPDGSPLALSHIAYSGQRFIGNVVGNTGYIQWTPPGPGNHASWPVVGPYYSEAEAAPDPVVAVFANTNTVWAFGTSTTQVYIPDAVIAFSTGASLETGAVASTIVGMEDGSFAWLDDKQRFVTSRGAKPTVISDPGMTKTAKALTAPSDCWAANIMIGQWDLVVWDFSTDGVCFWYERSLKKWGQWSGVDEAGEPIAWGPRSYAYLPADFSPSPNTHLIGMADGRIAELSLEAATDDGEPIVCEATTGFQNRGTMLQKVSERVQVQVRRIAPAIDGSTDPVFEYRYRDTLGAWRVRQRRSLAASSLQPTVDLGWALGQYRQRQHRITFSDAYGLVLTGATETFSIGEEAT